VIVVLTRTEKGRERNSVWFPPPDKEKKIPKYYIRLSLSLPLSLSL